MDLDEFMREFLPDYEAKSAAYVSRVVFEGKHFCEALQNFADRICEKQRVMCANNAFKRDWVDRMAVEEAEQPKIEEL